MRSLRNTLIVLGHSTDDRSEKSSDNTRAAIDGLINSGSLPSELRGYARGCALDTILSDNADKLPMQVLQGIEAIYDDNVNDASIKAKIISVVERLPPKNLPYSVVIRILRGGLDERPPPISILAPPLPVLHGDTEGLSDIEILRRRNMLQQSEVLRMLGIGPSEQNKRDAGIVQAAKRRLKCSLERAEEARTVKCLHDHAWAASHQTTTCSECNHTIQRSESCAKCVACQQCMHVACALRGNGASSALGPTSAPNSDLYCRPCRGEASHVSDESRTPTETPESEALGGGMRSEELRDATRMECVRFMPQDLNGRIIEIGFAPGQRVPARVNPCTHSWNYSHTARVAHTRDDTHTQLQRAR